ncbi:MAG: MMPL family transporter [Chloroflexi bacterium]|nr:MMPL family transporter [Chloroflexota bacterium]
MFPALGHFVYRFRWPIIGAWIAILAASIVFTLNFSVPLAGASLTTPDMESEQALQALRKALNLSPTSIDVVFTDSKLTVDDASYRQVVEQTAARIKAMPDVQDITSFYSTGAPQLVSKDRHTTYLSVGLKTDPSDEGAFIDELNSNLEPGPPRAVVGGDMVLGNNMESVAKNDLIHAESFALPISLLVLLFIFGSVVAASLPVVMGGVTVAGTLAIIYLLARVTDVSVFSMNIVSMLGLGLGIDYSLLLVSRFREEMKREKDVERAVKTTISTAGKTIFFSGFIVFIGLSGLLFFPIMVFRSLAYGGMAVVVLSILAAVTLVPAALSVLGNRLNALTIRHVSHEDQLWRGISRFVTKYTVAILLVSLAIIGVLSWPVLGMRMGMSSSTSLPQSAEARQAADLLSQEFSPGEVSPVIVVLQSGGNVLSADNVAAGYALTKKLEADPRVERVEGMFNLDPRLTLQQYQALYANPSMAPPQLQAAMAGMSSQHLTMLTVVSKYGPMDQQTRQLVSDIRAMRPGGDLQVQVTGETATSIDVDSVLFSDFPLAIGVVFTVTFFVLLILLRSVIVPIKAALMTGFSILASLGVLVLIFQDGNLSNLLGFTTQGFIDSITPIMLFCILFGLSMDYEVFLLTRIKEAWDRTGDNTLAVREGVERTGRIITSAAAVMVVVTGAFAMTDLLQIKSIGMGAAVAILLDATVVRVLLVPSAMRLLGRVNWWAPLLAPARQPETAGKRVAGTRSFWSKWER